MSHFCLRYVRVALITVLLVIVVPELSKAYNMPSLPNSNLDLHATSVLPATADVNSSPGPKWVPVILPQLSPLARHKAVIVETTSGEFLCVIAGSTPVASSTQEVYCYQLGISGEPTGVLKQYSLGKTLRYHAATVAGSQVYVLGGREINDAISDRIYCLEYGPDGDWHSHNVGIMPRPTMQLAAVTVGDRVYAIGGYDGVGYLSNVRSAQTGSSCAAFTSDWRSETPLPGPVTGHAAVSVKLANGKKFVYVIGGLNTGGVLTNNVLRTEVYADGTLSGWTSLGPVANSAETMTGTWLLAAGVSGQYLYVIGGATNASENMISSAKQYRAQIDDNGGLHWRDSLQDLPVALHNHAVSVSHSGRLYIVGGFSYSAFKNDAYFTPLLELQLNSNPRRAVTYGDTTTFTLRLANLGVRDLGPLAITQTIRTDDPTQFNYPDSPDVCQDTSSCVITYTVSRLALEATRELTFPVGLTIPVPVLPVVSPLSYAPSGFFDVDLSVQKNGLEPLVVAGRLFTYTLAVYNSSQIWTAKNVTLTDTLPSGVSFVTATLQPTSYTPLKWYWDSLNPNARRDIQLTVKVEPSAPDILTNTATIRGNQRDPNPSNNNSQVWTYVVKKADLRVGLSDSEDPVMAGQELTYTLVVSNSGPSDALGIIVTNTLPSGTSFLRGTPRQGDSLNPLTWQVDLPVNMTKMITVVVNVNIGQGTICDKAGIASAIDTSPDNIVEECTGITSMANLAISKIVEPITATSGAYLTYTLTITNLGPSMATDTLVIDRLPSGVQFINADPPATQNSNTVTWTVPTLNRDQSKEFKLVVRVTTSNEDRVRNEAEVHSAIQDSDLGNNKTVLYTTIDKLARLSLKSISRTPELPKAGDCVTYTLAVSNDGPSDATGVRLKNWLPHNVELLATIPETSVVSPSLVTWNTPIVQAHQSNDFQIVLRVNSSAIGDLDSFACASSDTPDDNDDDDCKQDYTLIYPLTDLSLDKRSSLSNVRGGETLTYTLEIRNNGPSDAQRVSITDTIPHYLTLLSSSEPKWYTGTLVAGAVWNIPVVVRVDSSVHGLLVNTACVSNIEPPDTNHENDCDQEQTRASVILTAGGVVCEDGLWCQESNKVIISPFDVYLPVLLR